MKILQEYFELQKKIHEYFGYVEDWVTIPLDDATEYYWHFDGEEVVFSKEPLTEALIEDGERVYSNSLYRQRFLPKWEYRTEKYTMLSVDTHTDGNKYLRVFDNAKEIKEVPSV